MHPRASPVHPSPVSNRRQGVALRPSDLVPADRLAENEAMIPRLSCLIPAAFAVFASPLAAAEPPDLELVEIRHELERAGIRVDHLADTPEERRRELRDIARQVRELREARQREARKARPRPRPNRVGQGVAEYFLKFSLSGEAPTTNEPRRPGRQRVVTLGRDPQASARLELGRETEALSADAKNPPRSLLRGGLPTP